jgi:hypothetical protein
MRNTENGSGLGRWRWVIERTFAWLNQFRRLRLRYEKRADMHKALLSLACALICWGISYRVTSRDLRLPNRQAANEKIEARFFSWSITSGLPVIRLELTFVFLLSLTASITREYFPSLNKVVKSIASDDPQVSGPYHLEH